MHKFCPTSSKFLEFPKSEVQKSKLTARKSLNKGIADEEARAAKESMKEAAIALIDLRATYNAWRSQAIANEAAKHAQNLAKWQMRCEALPPGAQKPKRPMQQKGKDIPAQSRGVGEWQEPAG